MRVYDTFVGFAYGSLVVAGVWVWATEPPPPPKPGHSLRLTPGEAQLIRDKIREAGNRATEALCDAARLECERNRLAGENARLRLELDAVRRGVVPVGGPEVETIPAPKVPIPER